MFEHRKSADDSRTQTVAGGDPEHIADATPSDVDINLTQAQEDAVLRILDAVESDRREEERCDGTTDEHRLRAKHLRTAKLLRSQRADCRRPSKKVVGLAATFLLAGSLGMWAVAIRLTATTVSVAGSETFGTQLGPSLASALVAARFNVPPPRPSRNKETGVVSVSTPEFPSLAGFPWLHTTRFDFSVSTTEAGLAQLHQGRADVAMASRPVPEPEYEPTTIAFDGIAIVVNGANPIDYLTISEIRDLFSGKVKNWEDLRATSGNAVASKAPVKVRCPVKGHGTYKTFVKAIFGADDASTICPVDLEPRLNSLIMQVQDDEGAIAFVPRAMAIGVKIMPIGNSETSVLRPDDRLAVRESTYRLTRPLALVTRSEHNEPDAVAEFLEFAKRDPRAREVVEALGFVAASDFASSSGPDRRAVTQMANCDRCP
jgi:phosphate transport system substrate-binding protein